MKNNGAMLLGMIFMLPLLTLSLEAQSSKNLATDSRSHHEINGTIEQVSPTVRLIRITSTDQPDVTICIEPETKIKVRGREGSMQDLKKGQFVDVVLRRDSSKAISINAT